MGIPIDTDGNILVRCPKCEAEFKTAVSNITSETNENIICPSCNCSLDQVQLPERDVARAKEMLEKEAAKEFENELVESLKRAGFR